MGVGPVYVFGITLLTVAGIWASERGIISRVTYSYLYVPVAVFGVALILIGLFFWYSANAHSNLKKNIKNNNLITTGVYAYVRNPVYSAFLLYGFKSYSHNFLDNQKHSDII